MTHQARILPDGFECSCGYRPRYRRDADPARIQADLQAHSNKVRPTKDEITNLITELNDWEKKTNSATSVPWGQPLGPAKFAPDPPQDLIDRVRLAVDAFEWVRFPVLAEFVDDPGGPQIRDVVNQLGEARNLA